MVAPPLLSIKLQAPPLPSRILTRPQLLQMLEDGLEKRLTLVAAPAGYGKSTLLAAWHSRMTTRKRAIRPSPSAVRTAWLSLDENDNDPLRFLAYLLAAIQNATPHVGATTRAILEMQQQTQTEPLLIPLINDLAKAAPLLLMLDDYHVLHNPKIHAYVTFLLEHAPVSLHLAIGTRTAPPLPLGHWRAEGHLLEIGLANLQLSTNESRRFLQEVAHLPLTEKAMDLLQQRTEGWITGLQLAALFLQRNAGEEARADDLGNLVRAFGGGNDFLVEYLAGEVLLLQPPAIGRFLRQTAILPRFCASLCDAILDDTGEGMLDSQAIIDQLCLQNIFLLPLDHDRRWYRYHPLFAEFLQTQLERQEEPAAIAALHQRASQWFATNNYLEDAIHHALQAGDDQYAAHLIEDNCRKTWLAGDFHRLRRWFSLLPESAITASPRLCLYQAWVNTVDGDYSHSKTRLDQAAQTAANASGPPDPEVQAMQAAISPLLRFQHTPEPENTRREIRQALAKLPDSTTPWRFVGLLALGASAAELGLVDEAGKAYYEALLICEQLQSDYLTHLAFHNLIRFQLSQAQLRRAQETSLRLLDRAKGSRLHILLEAYAHFSLGEILLEWNQNQKAYQHLKKALRMSEQIGQQTLQTNILTRLAWFAQMEGTADLARAYFQQAESLVRNRTYDPASRTILAAQRAALALAQEDETGLDHWLHLVEAGIHHNGQSLTEGYRVELLTLAHSYIARAYATPSTELALEALDLLAQLQQHAENHGEGRLRLEVLALQACAQFILGDRMALKTLEETLALAEPEGFCRLFLVAGPPMEALLRHRVRQGRSQAYVEKLLLAFAASRRHQDNLLSEREKEVLRLVAIGQTNTAIATDLCISVNTVKTHLKRINIKLETNNRLSAVSRARELSLL
jgi:LuxR family maltose regulon positive regulatory protein